MSWPGFGWWEQLWVVFGMFAYLVYAVHRWLRCRWNGFDRWQESLAEVDDAIDGAVLDAEREAKRDNVKELRELANEVRELREQMGEPV